MVCQVLESGSIWRMGKRLANKWETKVLLFGKEGEHPIIYEILRHLGIRGIDLAGKLVYCNWLHFWNVVPS